VFAINKGWLLVCESSVRFFADCKEIARLEFGDVIVAARLVDSQLVVAKADGRDVRVTIGDGKLVVCD
jgi:hypothetical protein